MFILIAIAISLTYVIEAYQPLGQILDLTNNFDDWYFLQNSTTLISQQCGSLTYLQPFSLGTVYKDFTVTQSINHVQIIIDLALLDYWRANSVMLTVNNQPWITSQPQNNFLSGSTCGQTDKSDSFIQNWAVTFAVDATSSIRVQFKTNVNQDPRSASLLLRNLKLNYWNTCSGSTYYLSSQNTCTATCPSGYHKDSINLECKSSSIVKITDLYQTYNGWQFTDGTQVSSTTCGTSTILGGYNQLGGQSLVTKNFDLGAHFDWLQIIVDLYLIDGWSPGKSVYIRINYGFWYPLFVFSSSNYGSQNICGEELTDSTVQDIGFLINLNDTGTTVRIDIASDLDQTVDAVSFGLQNLRVIGWNTNDCSNNQFLLQDSCTASCPTNYFSNTVSRICEQCSNNCVYCPSGPDICLCSAQNYIDSQSKQCKPCDSSCSACFGSSSNQCSACKSQSYLYAPSSTCVSACPSGYRPNSQQNVCEKCLISYCSVCTSGTSQCDTCNSGFFQDPASGLCKACATGCLNCQSQATNCISCTSGLYLLSNTCVNNCPSSGYRKDSTRFTCSSCTDPNCQTCDSDISTCQQCQPGYYLDTTTTPSSCKRCDSTCVTCNGGLFTNCLSCSGNLFLSNTQCVRNCNLGTYAEPANNSCVSCDPRCTSCFGPLYTQCNTCNNAIGFFIYGGSTCYLQTCGDGKRVGTEQCDTGTSVGNLSGCDKSCNVQIGWACSRGQAGQSDTCSTICGDGIKINGTWGGAEQCDDGNTVSQDGCSSTCQIESQYTCFDQVLKSNSQSIPGSDCTCEPLNLQGELSSQNSEITINFNTSIQVANDTTNGLATLDACKLFLNFTSLQYLALGTAPKCSIMINESLLLLPKAIKYTNCSINMTRDLNLRIVQANSLVESIDDDYGQVLQDSAIVYVIYANLVFYVLCSMWGRFQDKRSLERRAITNYNKQRSLQPNKSISDLNIVNMEDDMEKVRSSKRIVGTHIIKDKKRVLVNSFKAFTVNKSVSTYLIFNYENGNKPSIVAEVGIGILSIFATMPPSIIIPHFLRMGLRRTQDTNASCKMLRNRKYIRRFAGVFIFLLFGLVCSSIIVVIVAGLSDEVQNEWLYIFVFGLIFDLTLYQFLKVFIHLLLLNCLSKSNSPKPSKLHSCLVKSMDRAVVKAFLPRNSSINEPVELNEKSSEKQPSGQVSQDFTHDFSIDVTNIFPIGESPSPIPKVRLERIKVRSNNPDNKNFSVHNESSQVLNLKTVMSEEGKEDQQDPDLD